MGSFTSAARTRSLFLQTEPTKLRKLDCMGFFGTADSGNDKNRLAAVDHKLAAVEHKLSVVEQELRTRYEELRQVNLKVDELTEKLAEAEHSVRLVDTKVYKVRSADHYTAIFNGFQWAYFKCVCISDTSCALTNTIAPDLNEFAKTKELEGRCHFFMVNVDEVTDLAKEKEEEDWPTFRFFEGDKLVEDYIGADIDEIKAIVKKRWGTATGLTPEEDSDEENSPSN